MDGKRPPQVRWTNRVEMHTQKGTADNRQGLRAEAVSSVFWCVKALKARGLRWHVDLPRQREGDRRGSGATQVVNDHGDVKTIHIQQVDQEGAVSLGIQPHGSHVVSGEGGFSTTSYLRQSLEDVVV